ncbi:MAG: leucine-rich repeat protein, partial [Muribaculaceae bacterium]|nr:leucine-rich repeat protein [Muribaculaceae bacterium]
FMNCAMENLYLGRTINRDYSVNYFGGVFDYNPKLKSVELGQYVTKIENYEFLNCPNIYSFTVGVGVREIEQYAVGYIPGSTDYVSDIWKLDKFVKTDIPKLIWLPNTRPQGYENLSGRINYVSQAAYQLPNQKEYRNLSSKFWVDGVLYVFNRQAADRTCVAIDCKYSPVYENTSVPSEVEYKGIKFAVEEINDYTFFNENYMKRVEIGNNIAQIGDYAFSGCANLTSVFVPNGVKTLGEWAFTGCKKLESVVLGNGLKEIRNGCFSGDENIAEIMVPANVSTIGNQVFDGCKGLSKLEIMKRDTDLNLGYSSKNVDLSSNPVPGRPLFADCELKEVYIGGNITYSATVEDGYSPFYRNDYIEKVTIFDHETEVSDYEFYGCRSLKEVYIGNDVEKIGVFAFSGCLELDIFSIGNKVKTIGEDAFSDCGKKMTKFISHTTVPPVCGSQALDDIDKFDCVLYVPASSVDAYANAEQWKNFFNIRPITDVAVPVTSVTFDVNTLSMEVGDQNRIEASVLPADASDARLIWESDNTEVAMVSQFGNVVAIGEGSCYITASTTDGSNLSASCFITVTDNAGVMEVTVSDLGIIREGNSISIVGAFDSDKVSIFTVGGTMVYGGFEKRIDNLPAGLYIVIVRNHVFKIMI